MFTRVIKPFNIRKRQDLSDTNVKLFSLKLSNISSCFDAHSLWDHKYGSRKEIEETGSGRSDFRLKKAIDKYRRVVNQSVEGKWMQRKEEVFTDVILWIPDEKWQDDIEVGGNNIAMLADTLSQFHMEDFKDALFGQREPHYVVMPDPK